MPRGGCVKIGTSSFLCFPNHSQAAAFKMRFMASCRCVLAQNALCFGPNRMLNWPKTQPVLGQNAFQNFRSFISMLIIKNIHLPSTRIPNPNGTPPSSTCSGTTSSAGSNTDGSSTCHSKKNAVFLANPCFFYYLCKWERTLRVTNDGMTVRKQETLCVHAHTHTHVRTTILQ